MKQVIFIDITKKAPKRLYVVLAWYIIAVLASIAFGIFVFRPDLLLVP